jgi:hypothetical protein
VTQRSAESPAAAAAARLVSVGARDRAKDGYMAVLGTTAVAALSSADVNSSEFKKDAPAMLPAGVATMLRHRVRAAGLAGSFATWPAAMAASRSSREGSRILTSTTSTAIDAAIT